MPIRHACLHRVGIEVTGVGAGAATESTAREPSPPTPEHLEATGVLLDAPVLLLGLRPASSRRFVRSRAMSVPASRDASQNNDLKKWLRHRSRYRGRA